MIIEMSLTNEYKKEAGKKCLRKFAVFSSKGGLKVTPSQQQRQSGRKLDTQYKKLQ